MLDFFYQTLIPLNICEFQCQNQRNLLGVVSFLHFQQLLNPCQIPEKRIKQKGERTPSLASKHISYVVVTHLNTNKTQLYVVILTAQA